MQILASLNWHKSRNDFVVTILADGWMNVVMRWLRKSERDATCMSVICSLSVTVIKGSLDIHFLLQPWSSVQDKKNCQAGIGLSFLQAISAIIAKVCISSDIIKPFSGKSDEVSWLKKVRLVAKLQKVNNMASLLPLYLEGGRTGPLHGDGED